MWPGPLNCYATHSIAVAYVHMGLILSTPGGLHGTRWKKAHYRFSNFRGSMVGADRLNVPAKDTFSQ